jgi:hypothetical protein
MNMKKMSGIPLVPVMLSVAVLLGGCIGVNEHEHHQAATAERNTSLSLSMPKVSLSFTPEAPKTGEPVHIHVLVTVDKQPVNDADRVQVEVWNAERSGVPHRMIGTKRTGNGVYTATVRLDQPGVYQVMYHVTANGSHVMNAQKLEVRR